MPPKFKIGDVVTAFTDGSYLAVVTHVAAEAKQYTLRHCDKSYLAKDYAFSDATYWFKVIVTFAGPVVLVK